VILVDLFLLLTFPDFEIVAVQGFQPVQKWWKFSLLLQNFMTNKNMFLLKHQE